jgi:hypothetical protein
MMTWFDEWSKERRRRREHASRLDSVRRWAQQGRVSELVAFLQARPDYNNHVFFALADIGSPPAVAALLQSAAMNPSKAAEALERIGSPEAAEALIRVMLELESGAARRALKEMHARLEPGLQSRIDEALELHRLQEARREEARAKEEKTRKDALRWCPRCRAEPAAGSVLSFAQDVDDGYFTLEGLKCGVCGSALLDGWGNSLVTKVQN